MRSGLIALTMSSLQERIEELINATGLSVPDVAKRAKVTPSAVSQWLGKTDRPTKSLKLKPAVYLERETGFSALWLSSGEGPKYARPPGPIAGISAVFPSISNEKWDSLSDRQKGIVEERVRLAVDEQAAALPTKAPSPDKEGAPVGSSIAKMHGGNARVKYFGVGGSTDDHSSAPTPND